MTQRIYIDRSRYETAQRCARQRWYEYHQDGMGIVSARKPLPLAVGSSVHVGLAELLQYGQMLVDNPVSSTWELVEEKAVTVALADFAAYQNALDIGDELRLPEGAVRNMEEMEALRHPIDEYLFREQSAVVEAIIRAYARRRLRPLLEWGEVLEVEREGEWLLAQFYLAASTNHAGDDAELWFMSRPDALLRERESNQLYLLSFKTAASWDIRKARDAEHDMQGMSEGIEIERRLGEWWTALIEAPDDPILQSIADKMNIPRTMARYLKSLDAPPRIHAVRMEYLLKGERWRDKDLSAQFGCEMRSQKSHLIRAYQAVSTPQRGTSAFSVGDLCWAWEYLREDGSESKLAWQNWRGQAIWEAGPQAIRQWIDKLDTAAETMSGEDSTMGLEPRMLGYKCDAQTLGLTREHPLDAVFIPPITIYRQEDELRDLVEQMEAQERRIAEGVAAVNAAEDEGERRHQLNLHFPQTRRACEFPTCAFVKICYGGNEVRRDPIGSGLYKIRIANHPQERQGSMEEGA